MALKVLYKEEDSDLHKTSRVLRKKPYKATRAHNVY